MESAWKRLHPKTRNAIGIVFLGVVAAVIATGAVTHLAERSRVRVTDLSKLSARELSEISKVSAGSVDDMTVVAVEEDYQRAELESGSTALDLDLVLVRFTDRDGQVCYAEYRRKANEEFQRWDQVGVCLTVDGRRTVSYEGEKVYRRLAEADPGELLDLCFSRKEDSPASYLRRERRSHLRAAGSYAVLLILVLCALVSQVKKRKRIKKNEAMIAVIGRTVGRVTCKEMRKQDPWIKPMPREVRPLLIKVLSRNMGVPPNELPEWAVRLAEREMWTALEEATAESTDKNLSL